MFDATLQAQALDATPRRLGSVSLAAIAHLGAAAVLAVIAALTVQPIQEPRVEPIRFTRVLLPPEPSEILDPRPPGRPPGQTGPRQPAVAPTPPVEPLTQPTETPAELPVAPDGPPIEGPVGFGDPDGPNEGPPGTGGRGHGDGPGLDDGDGSGGPRVLTGEMVAPKLVTRVEPVYPRAARIARLEGRVIVEAVIGLDGGVESVRVLSSTNILFDDAATEAVRQWRYTPATMDGRPVRVYFTVVVTFVVR